MLHNGGSQGAYRAGMKKTPSRGKMKHARLQALRHMHICCNAVLKPLGALAGSQVPATWPKSHAHEASAFAQWPFAP